MTSMKSELDRLFDQFMTPAWVGMPDISEWAPRLDVKETKDAFVVTAEVPGIAVMAERKLCAAPVNPALLW